MHMLSPMELNATHASTEGKIIVGAIKVTALDLGPPATAAAQMILTANI